MDQRELDPQGAQALEQVLGYLNYSAGNPDGQFLANLNLIFAVRANAGPGSEPTPGDVPLWRDALDRLEQKLRSLESSSPVFVDSEQARSAIILVRDHLLPGYREFHRDLLFHQDDDRLFTSLFVGRAFEVVLRQGAPWDDVPRIVRASLHQLNDYLGHRPLAALESQKIEPYSHEWIRPVPLFVRGAGVAVGPQREVIEMALELLRQTEPDLQRAAQFDPQRLEELAMDPRAYDFDHPVNKRPNYHFGQWDPHQIDNQGYYRRFVMQQVTLDALMKRLNENDDLPREELVYEAGAVLAGTVIMASGISGAGPDAHDSSVTLSNLLPRIAKYRDMFYERLMARATGARAVRLQTETIERKQPFGGARQHLNQELARRRASQLEHVHLAKIFARMGYADAAARQANVVPTAAARMQCQIDCWLTAGHQAISAGQLPQAAELLPKIMEHLRRAIECGAIIDPWNILGFDAHFSLFPALENSVHDHRADELCALMENVFGLFSQVWSEAAARDDQPLAARVSHEFHEVVVWWHKFAAHEVSSVEAVNAMDAYRAAERVAAALNLWHKGGASAGDVAFWAPHAEVFDSPQAYTLVVETLLKKNDFVASMALLVHWLGQAERVGLESGESSFHRLAELWLMQLLGSGDAVGVATQGRQTPARLVRKFFDYLEANAERFWQIPTFELAPATGSGSGQKRPAGGKPDPEAAPDDNDEEPGQHLFDAAYESVVYRDTTDDGVDGPIFDTDDSTRDELTREYRRIASRLAFHSGLARLWRLSATSPVFVGAPETTGHGPGEPLGVLRRWSQQAGGNYAGLLDLLETVRAYRIPAPLATHEAMIEFDQKRLTKEAMLENVVATAVEMADAQRLLLSAVSLLGGDADDPIDAAAPDSATTDDPLERSAAATPEQRLATQVRSAMLDGDLERIRELWPDLLNELRAHPLLYVSLAKGGRPHEMIAARIRQRTLQDLLAGLPRLGLIQETCELIDTARLMEKTHPVGPGAVTEFDEMFRIGLKSIVENLVASTETWAAPTTKKGRRKTAADVQAKLVECLERITESLLMIWLTHSRTLRLSMLEKVHDKSGWKRVVDFIQQYGGDLFSQRFLNAGNIRSILHHGVDTWLRQLEDDGGEEADIQLLRDLDKKIPRTEAVEHLTLILDSIYENYGEYRDYNSTTTQSDRGELLYTLLDFLRLRSKYDRVAWNLKPVMWVHDVLVRRGFEEAAKTWRRALSERINEEAEQYMVRLADLQKKYSMRMPTVADRLAERFIRPMTIDRMRGLVGPAMREANGEEEKISFELLEHETETLTLQPSGAGLDVPAWLMALEEEVERARQPFAEQQEQGEIQSLIPLKRISHGEARRQIALWADRNKKDV